AVILGEHAVSVGKRNRDDLAAEEAVLLCCNRALLAAERELIHLLARDLLSLRHVLRRLAHGDVDVGIALAVAGLQLLVLTLRHVARSVEKPRDALDAHAEEHVALAGTDRMRRDARALQGRRAVPGDRRTRHIEPGQDADHASEVEPLLAAGEAASA